MSQATLFHYGTLGALMAGVYEGSLSIGQLLEHGSMGIGTLDGIDGELIIVDGKAYQATGDTGQARVFPVTDDQIVPYAAVIDPIVTQTVSVDQLTESQDLHRQLEEAFGGENLFYSIRMTGRFSRMHVRMIPKSRPDQAFAEVASHQPEFTREEVEGTVVGIWTPALFHGVSVAGFHLHFLSDDHQFGGHIMDYALAEGSVEIGQVDQLEQGFPTQTPAYRQAHFRVDEIHRAIEASE